MNFPLSKFINKLKKKFKWYKPEAEGVVLLMPKIQAKNATNVNT